MQPWSLRHNLVCQLPGWEVVIHHRGHVFGAVRGLPGWEVVLELWAVVFVPVQLLRRGALRRKHGPHGLFSVRGLSRGPVFRNRGTERVGAVQRLPGGDLRLGPWVHSVRGVPRGPLLPVGGPVLVGAVQRLPRRHVVARGEHRGGRLPGTDAGPVVVAQRGAQYATDPGADA